MNPLYDDRDNDDSFLLPSNKIKAVLQPLDSPSQETGRQTGAQPPLPHSPRDKQRLLHRTSVANLLRQKS